MKKVVYILIFLNFTINCFPQFSKTHYIPPLVSANNTAVSQNNFAGDQYLYISTPSLVDVHYTITPIGGNPITGTVNKNSSTIYPIGSGDNTQLLTPSNLTGTINNKGYIVDADDLIYVSARVNAGASNNGYSQAGGLVSKGNSALGTTFRLGAMINPDNTNGSLLNFASVMATENGTKITISDIPGARLTDGTIVSGPIIKILDKNQSYAIALLNNTGGSPSNSSKIIGGLIQSDKPVVVNCGSFGGSNSPTPRNLDLGFDQIVSVEKTGTEYVFVKGNGGTNYDIERVLIIANSDNTQVYLNGSATPVTTLNAGKYIIFDGSQYIDGNMYVTTSANVFAYQSIGGTDQAPNQNMCFVPPINCSTPNTVDNIPWIDKIGYITFTNAFLNIVTENGATVLLNDSPINTAPYSIQGTSALVRYTIPVLSENIAVKSTKQVYVSYYGTNGAATYGGYYSGFDLKPEIVSQLSVGASTECIPNVTLKINPLSSYDTFQWYKDEVEILGENNRDYTPTSPGIYMVKGSIFGCPSNTLTPSDNVPVSECSTNNDNDLANDNIDIDYDNDGITNCTESDGDIPLNFSNSNSGTIGAGTFSNSFSGSITNTGSPAAVPFSGMPDGSFVTAVSAGKGNSVIYNLNFNNPINLSLEYPLTANSTDLLNPNSEYIVNSDIDKTVTVLNPNDQLLIDTNYDGIYESGVKQFSSFEIRFRLNSTVPLPTETSSFKFQSYQTKSFKITHKNLSDTADNKSTFKLIATCFPKDSDGDGVPDQLDLDSDNDGVPDVIESQSQPKALSNTDINLNGLDDMFESTTTPIDTDNDGVPNYLDLDSDNDGIYDLVESGSNSSNALDIDRNGIIDGNSFGTNGLANSLETTPDSGVLNYTVSDSDADNIKNYTETDSDNDGCNDVIEAGFSDPNFDGQLGDIPLTVNRNNGIVTSGSNGYTPLDNLNYLFPTPIIITKQPENQSICEFQNTSFTTESNAETFQWQVSTDGGNIWNALTDNNIYSGTQTATITIINATLSMNGYQYRVLLNRNNNACGLTSANSIKLTVFALPVLNPSITLIQCDDDTDGISNFNLTEKNSFISSNFANETFTYFTTLPGATTNDPTKQISNPLAYTSNDKSIWTRVENSNGCISVAQLDLEVHTTQIDPSFKRILKVCDDYIDTANDDKDGITAFDFGSVTTDILTMLQPPTSNYSIKYYTSEADALAETNAIINPSNYRNSTPNQQEIWVRVDSNLDNSCFGLGNYVTLQVNPRPNIDINSDQSSNKLICSNLPTFFVHLNAGIIGNIPANTYNYAWSKDGSIMPGETNETLDVNEEGKYSVEVFNKNDNSCSRIRTITVTASDIASLNSVNISDLSESNTVEANVSGLGDYDYSINAPNGPFQDSNFFENVPPGIHELYIHDKNGCGTISKTIAVLGIPKFFTPNNDGYNDYWNIKGANDVFNSGAKIFIYDRYGKVIKQIFASSPGWDGTYIGNPMPADDYWYTIKLEDGREAKGHFSLQR